MDPQKPVQPVQSPSEKTLYNTSKFDVFFRNFLAGFGKSLGSVFIYLLFLIASYVLFYRFAYPRLQPILSTFSQLGTTVQSLQQVQSGFSNPPSITLPSSLDGIRIQK